MNVPANIADLVGKLSIGHDSRGISFEDCETTCEVCGTALKAHRQIDTDGNIVSEWTDPCFVCETRQEQEKVRLQRAQSLINKGAKLGEPPALLKNANFANTHSRIGTQVKVVKAFCDAIINRSDRPLKTILMHGGNGLGKSWLAASAVNYLREKGLSSAMMDAVDVAHSVRSAWKKDRSPDEVYADFLTPDLLVIDEMGTPESLRDNLASVWSRVIQKRFDNALPLIVVTNQTPEQMLERLEPRLSDRLFDSSRTFVMPFTGMSFRSADRSSAGMSKH